MRDRLIDPKEYAAAMRETAVRDENGIIKVSPVLWEKIASLIERAIIPPCKVGDTVYVVSRYYTGTWEIYESTIKAISVYKKNTFISILSKKGNFDFGKNVDEIGKTVFLNREDAERALEEINGNNT